MTRYDAKIWTLAVAIAAMAGYVDAIGFLKLGGLFVSFMSGNTTRLSVGIVTDPPVAIVAACLATAFVAGVVVATLLAAAAGTRRKPAVLALAAALLAMAALIDGHVEDRWTTLTMAVAMGATNTVFQRAGEVSIAVTYMTGALVKLGQRLAGALLGGAGGRRDHGQRRVVATGNRRHLGGGGCRIGVGHLRDAGRTRRAVADSGHA